LTAAQLVRDRQELKLDEVQRQVPVLVTQLVRELALMLALQLVQVLQLAQAQV
jgi:hypothetical protein